MSRAIAVWKSISPPVHNLVVRRSGRQAAEECREGEMFQRSVCWWSGIEGAHRAEGIRASHHSGF
jgi:hypothetical protein